MWFGQGESRPEVAVHLRTVAANYAATVVRERAALVCGAHVRPPLAEFFRRVGIRLDVYAYGELPPELELRPALIASFSEHPRHRPMTVSDQSTSE